MIRINLARLELLAATVLTVAGWSGECAADTAPTAASEPAVSEEADAGSRSDAAALSEIVVTAQRRSQRLVDVPITINAATADQLASAGVRDVSSLAKVAPSFAVAVAYNGVPSFSLRGINFSTSQISSPPSVSAYVDEAALPYSVMTGWMLLDVDHVEVLKGPQGTLFGQNSTGGSINVVAAKPTRNFSAGIRTDLNNFGQLFSEAYASGPITDTLRIRIAANTTQFGAWQRGYYLTPRSDENGNQDKASGRILLDWTPTDRLKIGVNFNANYDHSDDQVFQIGAIAPVNPPAEPFPGLFAYPAPRSNRDADFTSGFSRRRDDRQYQAVLRADYTLADDVTLTSLTNYTDFKMRHPLDGDGTAFNMMTYSPNGSVRAFGEEVRVTGKALDKRLTYIVGANFQRDSMVDANDVDVFATSQEAGVRLRSPVDFLNRTAAIFGNVDLEVARDVTVTAGVRYTDHRQHQTGCTTGVGPVPPGIYGFVANSLRAAAGLPATSAYDNLGLGDCLTIDNVAATAGGVPTYLPTSLDQYNREHNISWRTGVNYKITPDAMVYGLVSRGYKAGTFPGSIAIFFATDLPYVRQEQITSYEIGTKLGLLDRRLQINASAFYYDYVNKQFLTYVEIPVLVYNQELTNIPKSNVRGVDLDVTATPVRGLTLRGAVTYIKTKIGSYEANSPIVNPATGHLTPIDLSGKPFNFAPPWTATADAEYKRGISAHLSGYIGANMLYNASTNSDITGDPLTKIDSYTVLDARFGVESDTGWSAGFFVRNLADKHYYTSSARTGDIVGIISGMPRVYGLTASYRF
ncbi:MAG TPA: TonB-dependent receptor [Steroidobacteraceae bacterium]|nr:TonB-dependent receptor [Steroidobacteraceae bacterium]